MVPMREPGGWSPSGHPRLALEQEPPNAARSSTVLHRAPSQARRPQLHITTHGGVARENYHEGLVPRGIDQLR